VKSVYCDVEPNTNLPETLTFNDGELLAKLSKRDPEAFQTLIRIYFPILCSFAAKMLPDGSLAKDIVQETFISFWNHQGSFETPASLKSFLFTVTRNGCLNLLRSREREQNRYAMTAEHMPQETDSVLGAIIRSEVVALIYQLVQDLPPKMQQVFYLSFEEGLSIEEIAGVMNISAKTVRNQKYNALQVLRKKVRDRPDMLLALLGFLIP